MAPLVAFIPLIAAGIGAAVAGVELTNMPSSPAAAPSAPTQTSTQASQAAAEQAAALAQAHALQQRRGMASTVLTSPMGVGGSQTQQTTLGT